MVCTLHITHPQGLQGRWVHTRRPLKGCGTGLGTPGSPVLSSPTPISLFTLIFTRPPERMNLSLVFPPFARSSHFQYLRLRRCNRDFCRSTSEHRVVSTIQTRWPVLDEDSTGTAGNLIEGVQTIIEAWKNSRV